VLISLLRDTSAAGVKADPIFRRRALAALGELIFYISAQEEGQGDGTKAWQLAPGTVSVITRCLADESDEVIRHYAAKVSVQFTMSNCFWAN
jgi:hypothetical protein